MVLKLSKNIFLTAFFLSMNFACQSTDSHAVKEQNEVALSTAGNEKVRQVATLDESEMDVVLSQILADAANGAKTHTQYLERQLNIYFRAEYQMVRFEQNLKEILEKQKTNPDLVQNPLEHDSYTKLLMYWKISHDELHKIEYVYEHVLKLSHDFTISEVKRNAASKIISEMHNWLEARTDAEKTQLIELVQSLKEIKESVNSKTSLNDGSKNRTIASVDSYSFKGYRFLEKADLKAVFKKEKQAIQKFAQESSNVKNPWVDGMEDFKIQFMENRKPSSNNPAVPNPGPDGNFFGLGCPVGTFVLSFDDGPRPVSTERLLGYLSEYSDRVNRTYPATFFVLLKNVRQFPDTIKKEQAAGFGVHDHSLTHPDLHAVSHDQRVIEVVNTIPELKKVLGHNFEFFRCPYGSCVAPAVPEVRQMIADAGLIHAHWSIDSLDWKNIGQPDRTLDIIMGQMKAVKRGTILMHDIHDSSVDAAKKLFDYIKQQNDSGAQNIKLLSLEQAVINYNASTKK